MKNRLRIITVLALVWFPLPDAQAQSADMNGKMVYPVKVCPKKPEAYLMIPVKS